MRITKPLLMMLCIGLFVLSAPLAGRADEWDKKTTMTFNAPVEVPGMVLAPGTYVFKLLDLASNRNVVQIFNADESHLYGNIMAIPAYHLEPSDRTVVTFEERAEGSPQAISTWFYPGDNYGEEFVYPEMKATGVAALPTQKNPVPAPEAISILALPEQPAVQAEQPAAITSIPKAQPAQIAQNTAPPKPAETPAVAAVLARPQQEIPEELPRTAGPVPVLILIGLLSLGASVSIHIFSKRPV